MRRLFCALLAALLSTGAQALGRVVSYEELPAVADVHAAIKSGAPQLHPEAPGNQVYDWVIGDEGATDDTTDDAERKRRAIERDGEESIATKTVNVDAATMVGLIRLFEEIEEAKKKSQSKQAAAGQMGLDV